ncbi:MAG TPA: DUF5666 domain-containing protein [Burkholderiaceae bacterium]|nr:DUF5666 domain-containing protein [Burkholderiaceae bacterium]
MNRLKSVLVWLMAVALGACGGGDMVARIGGGGSGAPPSTDFGVGGVGGFGSIIINGQHYDDTAGQFQVDERPDQPATISVDAVRLGMQMQFESQSNRISKAIVAAEVVGPVTSVAAASLIVLGQTVRVNADPALPTVFDGFSALSDLAAGSIVEVHGQRNAAGEVLATRIELRVAAGVLRVAGIVTDLNAGKFKIGSLTVQSATATIVPAGQLLANGQRVAVWTDQPLVAGELVARVIRIGPFSVPSTATMTIDGVVTDYVSTASLRISGFSVDASAAQFVGGTAADLGNGRSVRASGAYAVGVLKASRIEFLGAAPHVELSGAINDYVDAASPFSIRNALARVTPQTTYVGGDASNLGDSVLVKAEGALANGVVEIARLEFQPLVNGIERVLFGTVAAPLTVAQDGTRTFRLMPLPYEVKTTLTTRYKKGVVTDLALGRGVKVDGTYNGTQLVADEIQFMDNVQDPPTFLVEGIASNVQAASVVVNGTTVGLTPQTVYTTNGAAATFADLKNGRSVTINAVKVNGKLVAVAVDIQAAATGSATVRGLVSGRTPPNAAEFLVGSQRVSVANNPQVIPGNKTLADIRNGTDLEVQGTIANGLLTATRVRFK